MVVFMATVISVAFVIATPVGLGGGADRHDQSDGETEGAGFVHEKTRVFDWDKLSNAEPTCGDDPKALDKCEQLLLWDGRGLL